MTATGATLVGVSSVLAVTSAILLTKGYGLWLNEEQRKLIKDLENKKEAFNSIYKEDIDRETEKIKAITVAIGEKYQPEIDENIRGKEQIQLNLEVALAKATSKIE